MIKSAASVTLDDLPVEIVHWPADAARREVLARAGVSRILLVAPDATPPAMLGLDEDWVRMPADVGDVAARVANLHRFSEHLSRDEPFIDANRVLHRAGVAVQLSATEAAVMSLLLRQRGRIVAHEDLSAEVWNGDTNHDAIDAAIYRLRRRLAGLSLCIRSARGRGFVLDLEH